jgi:hypothetical protein
MNQSSDLQAVSPLERYQLFRNRIEHEDNLVMQRLSWLMASQSFLFTAYAIVTNGLTTSGSSERVNIFVHRLVVLATIIPSVALLNSLLILLSIAATLKAINDLRCAYHQQTGNLEILRLQANPSTRALGLSAPVLLPLLFLAVWLYLLMQ